MVLGIFIFAKRLFAYAESYERTYAAICLIIGIPFIGVGLAVFWFEGLGSNLFKSAETLEQVRGIWFFAFAALWLVAIGRAAQISFEFIRANPSIFVGLGAVIFLVVAYLAADYYFELPIIDFIGPNAEAR